MKNKLVKIIIIIIAVSIINGMSLFLDSSAAFAQQTNSKNQKYINGLDIYLYSEQLNKRIEDDYIDEGYIPNNSSFQNNCSYYNTKTALMTCNIWGDDNITKIIPREYFSSIGERIIFNQDIGYIINTKAKDNFLYSTVIMLDLIKNLTNNNEIMAEIKVLFKMDYYFVNYTYPTTMMQNTNGNFWDNIRQANIFENGIRNAVIPMPKTFIMPEVKPGEKEPTDTFYLGYMNSGAIDIADITFSTRLYNANSPNQSDTDYYNINNDRGYFITNNFVEYQATVTEGHNVYESVKNIGKELINLVLGVVPYVGSAITVLNGAINVATAASPIFAGVTYTEGKYVPSSNVFLSTKTEQISEYNHLIKSVTNKVESTESKKVRFNSGDFARAKTYITCQNENAPLQYTKAYVDIGMKVIDSSGSRAIIPVSLEYDINDSNEFILQEFSPMNYYILPQETQYFSLTPVYNAEYTVRLNKDLDIYLNDSKLTGHQDPENSNYKYYTFLLNSNRKYSFVLKNNNNNTLKSDYFTVTCAEALNREFSIQPNQEFLIKASYNQGDSSHNIFYTDNTNIKIIRAYDSNLNHTAHIFNNYEIVLNASETYYLLVKNTDTVNEQTLKFKKKEPIVIIPGSSVTQMTVTESEIYKKYKFTAPSTMMYYFTFDNKSPNNNYEIKIFNSAQNIKQSSLFIQGNKKNYKVGLAANEVIYFVLSKSNNLTSNLLIEHSYATKDAYTWFVDGVALTTSEIHVIRGQSVDISLKLNNITIPFDESYIYNPSNLFNVNGKNDKLNIMPNCLVGNIELDFKVAWKEEIFGGSQYLDIARITVNINFEPEMRTSFSAYYKGDDFGLIINNKDITSVSYTVIHNGNNFNFHYSILNSLKTTDDIITISIRDKINWTYSQPIISIKINKIFYNFVTNKNENHIMDADNLTYGLNIPNITSNCAFSGGSGTTASPFNVATVAQFNKIASNLNKCFKQTVNLDFQNKSHGLHGLTFGGDYDGNDYEFKNIIFKNEGSTTGSRGGIFAQNNGIIRNLNLKAINLTFSNIDNAGGIVAINKGDIYYVKMTSVSLSIDNFDYAGGLVGMNDKNIDDVIMTGVKMTVKNTPYAGGVVGKNSGTIDIINMTESNLTFQNMSFAGGVVGINNGSLDNLVIACFIISNNVIYTGGIAGQNNLNINNSKILIKITTNNNAGLVVGANYGRIYKIQNFIDNAYLIIPIIELTAFGDYSIGGLIGINYSQGFALSCNISSMIGYLGPAVEYKDTGSKAPRIGQITGEDFYTNSLRYAGTTYKNTVTFEGELKVVKNWLGLKPIDQARFVGGTVGKQN